MMWSTQTFWFDIAIVSTIFAVGNIVLGHFEEHRPKWRRLLKMGMVLVLALTLAYFDARWVFYLMLALMVPVVAYIHCVWLPRHGINGWTGEPRERYLALVRGSRGHTTK